MAGRSSLAVLLLCLPALARAQASPLVQKIEALYSRAESLHARFQIETVNQAIGEPEIEKGEIFVSRPNRMRWQYSDPQGKLVLLDGTYQWMYLPEEGQAFRGEQTQTSSELTLTLLADPGTLQKRFEIREQPAPQEPGAAVAHSWLRLEPREAQQDFDHVVLGVDPASGQVLAMDIVDKFKNTTKIRFSGIEFNPRLSPKLYELKLPKGTELLNFQGEPIEE
jgi:outer membrane lipoprotein carrier protein